MHRFTRLFTAGLCAVAAASAAYAQTTVNPVEGVVNPAVLGAGGTGMGPSQSRSDSGAGGYSATDIARSFFFADTNHDGELTRAEFRRLSIVTMSFEEMDRNFDGVISRFEYEDSLH